MRSTETGQTVSLRDCSIRADIVIMSVGTEVSYGGPDTPDKGWEVYLDEGWNRQIVVEEAKRFDKLRFQVLRDEV